MAVFDVAIIGGGLAGCSAALHLRQRGASVVLFERRLCGSQASGVNYGGVRQQGRHRAELPLARRSRKIWGQLETLVGSNCEYTISGHFKLAMSEIEMAELENYAEQARDYGLTVKLFSRSQLIKQLPFLGQSVAGGSFCPEDGQANPRLVTPAFARAAKAAGADIREGVEISTVDYDDKTFHLHPRDSSPISAGKLLNVAGAWGSKISEQFGEPVPEAVMSPNMCVTDPIPYFLEPSLGVCGGSIYMRQIPRGNVIFGAGVGIGDREQIKSRPLADVTAHAARKAIDLVPSLVNASIIRTWAGIEGVMPDGLPVIAASQTTPGLVHAFGFSGHGFQLGPAVGAVLTELVLDGETPTTIDGLDIDRFSQSDI